MSSTAQAAEEAKDKHIKKMKDDKRSEQQEVTSHQPTRARTSTPPHSTGGMAGHAPSAADRDAPKHGSATQRSSIVSADEGRMLVWRVTLRMRHFVQAEQWCGLVSRDEPPQPVHAAITAPSVAVRTNPSSTQALNPIVARIGHPPIVAASPTAGVERHLTAHAEAFGPSLNAQALVVLAFCKPTGQRRRGVKRTKLSAARHIRTGAALTPPHPHRDWAYPCHIRTGTGR